MSTYITLSRINIENANCISGLTYGFPSVTHFLGYVHALSKKLKNKNLALGGCAIVCHQHQVHVHQPKGWGDYVFSQTRNPSAFPYQKDSLGTSPPIIEEGKMHLTVSLVIECQGVISDTENLKVYLKQLAMRQKIAGGAITKIDSIDIDSSSTEEEQDNLTRKIRRKLLPGFMLLDRSELLLKQFENLKQKGNSEEDVELLDAWLDFSALKSKAEKKSNNEEEAMADWKYVRKPASGYLVPLMTGYRAISDVYNAGVVSSARDQNVLGQGRKYCTTVVANARDPDVPFCFVEAVYGVGQWSSPHHITNIQDALWQYEKVKGGWYLCKNEHNLYFEDEFDNDEF